MDDADALVICRTKVFTSFSFAGELPVSCTFLVYTNEWCDLFFQIRKMDLEARSLQPSVKAVLLAKLREYKSDLNNLKREIKRITSPDANQAAREELLESGMADVHAVSVDSVWIIKLQF